MLRRRSCVPNHNTLCLVDPGLWSRRSDEAKMGANPLSRGSLRIVGQMFRHGSVHCDPHGANVLVRPHPRAKKGSGRPQLVLLDHGLYRELTEQFRVDHCRLWKAMVFKDVPGMITDNNGILRSFPIYIHICMCRGHSRGRFSRCFADGVTGTPPRGNLGVGHLLV